MIKRVGMSYSMKMRTVQKVRQHHQIDYENKRKKAIKIHDLHLFGRNIAAQKYI